MRVGNIDYISITDLAHYKDKDRTDYIIQNWMRTTNSLLFLGTGVNNENFNFIKFDGFKKCFLVIIIVLLFWMEASWCSHLYSG